MLPWVVIAGVGLACASIARAQTVHVLIAPSLGQNDATLASCISANGSIVGGVVLRGGSLASPTWWDAGTGTLSGTFGVNLSSIGFAASSATGEMLLTHTGSPLRPVLVSTMGGGTTIPDGFGSGGASGLASVLSADGSLLGGAFVVPGTGSGAWRWDVASGQASGATLNFGEGRVLAMSADGLVLSIETVGGCEIHRISAGGGVTSEDACALVLGQGCGVGDRVEVLALSGDGSVMAGTIRRGTTVLTWTSFVWSAATGLVEIASCESGLDRAHVASALSGDGLTVAGASRCPGIGGVEEGAWVWRSDLGLRLLRDVSVASGLGQPDTLWGSCAGVSGDGSRIAGNGVLASGAARGWVLDLTGVSFPACDSIDFNNDTLFPDDADLIDFLSVFAGGACGTGDCNDIDFNNDSLFPDDGDLVAFLTVLAGGAC